MEFLIKLQRFTFGFARILPPTLLADLVESVSGGFGPQFYAANQIAIMYSLIPFI